MCFLVGSLSKLFLLQYIVSLLTETAARRICAAPLRVPASACEISGEGPIFAIYYNYRHDIDAAIYSDLLYEGRIVPAFLSLATPTPVQHSFANLFQPRPRETLF